VNDRTRNSLTFGIYPGSAVGDSTLENSGQAGPPDQPDRIDQALAQLQGVADRRFIVRAYDMFADPGDVVQGASRQAPVGYDRYLGVACHARCRANAPQPGSTRRVS
jgi:hypothetical protein